MTITVLSSLLFFIFTSLGLLHFYWLFGGKWGLKKVIPTIENQASTLSIPKFATLIVALVLVLFGLIYLVKSGLMTFQIPDLVTKYGYWFIPGIFTLRAVGDFKYVGFFKKLKHTEFAKADSKFFSPLCLMVGIFGILLQFMSK